MVSRITPENYFSMETDADQNKFYSIIIFGIVAILVFSGTLIFALTIKERR
jgi:hypothetical protein